MRDGDEGTRLGLVTLTALASVLPIELIMEAIQSCGRQAKRIRKLPPEVVTWLVVGMGLCRGKSTSNVLRRVMEGLGDVLSWGLAELPHSTSITHARDRLGWETVRLIFRKLAEHLSVKHATASVWRGLRALALDGTTFMTADTPANDAAFGRPGTSRGGARSAYPRMRGVVLMGAWCHLIAEVVLGPYRGTSEVGRLYRDRWEAEVGYRELKIHMGENRVLFRSQRPDRVLQEAYGLLIAYNCVRALMAEAAAEIEVEPRQLSFVDCLDRIRLAVTDLARAAPEELPALRARLVADLARCRVQPKQEGRRYDRAESPEGFRICGPAGVSTQAVESPGAGSGRGPKALKEPEGRSRVSCPRALHSRSLVRSTGQPCFLGSRWRLESIASSVSAGRALSTPQRSRTGLNPRLQSSAVPPQLSKPMTSREPVRLNL